MRPTRRFVRRGRNRRGFTLVELVVAIMVISIGVIGLASTAGAVTRQMGGGRRMLIASNVARARLEWFAAQNCATLSTGSANSRGVAEAWTVTQGTLSVQVQLGVTYTTTRGNRTQSYSARIPCRQLTVP
jgi:prepilin-type N-terminal cleavage/methylation domain-containing protein